MTPEQLQKMQQLDQDYQAVLVALKDEKNRQISEYQQQAGKMAERAAAAEAELKALQSECDLLRRIHDKTHQTIDRALAVLTVQKPQLGQSTWRLADDFYKAIQDAIKILTGEGES